MTQKNTPSPAHAPAALPVPAGYMIDAQGRLVPESKVKPIDLLRDQTVREIVKKAKATSAVLRDFKVATFSDISAFIQASAEQYAVNIGGDKGNVTLYSFDGRYKVMRAIHENIKFDERVMAAKALIDECITAWSEGSSDEIKVLINDAFRVDKEGEVSANRVLGLRRLNIKDPKWCSAMEAIADSFVVVGSRSYVRVYERIGDTNQYQSIPLDVAGV